MKLESMVKEEIWTWRLCTCWTIFRIVALSRIANLSNGSGRQAWSFSRRSEDSFTSGMILTLVSVGSSGSVLFSMISVAKRVHIPSPISKGTSVTAWRTELLPKNYLEIIKHIEHIERVSWSQLDDSLTYRCFDHPPLPAIVHVSQN